MYDGGNPWSGGYAVPAKSGRQQKLFGADLARARAGKPTATGLSEKKLEEMAQKPKKGAPKGARR